jgi:hypothetical protein
MQVGRNVSVVDRAGKETSDRLGTMIAAINK